MNKKTWNLLTVLVIVLSAFIGSRGFWPTLLFVAAMEVVKLVQQRNERKGIVWSFYVPNRTLWVLQAAPIVAFVVVKTFS